jgi:hypothetical protein
MSTKLICDGCGHDIQADVREDGSFMVSRAILQAATHGEVSWDLCVSCFDRVKSAVSEVTPHSPRSEWDHVLKPTKG